MELVGFVLVGLDGGFAEYIWAKLVACNGAISGCFDCGAAFSGNLSAYPPVADNGLTDAERASEGRHAGKVLNCLIECFHAHKYHAMWFSLSTQIVFVHYGGSWVNTP